MDKKTQEMLIELDLLRSLDWAPGTTVSGQDVHGTIAFLKGITRSLRLGTVFSERERKEKIETRLQSRRAVRRFRETIGRLLDAVDEMNDLLRAVADGILNSIGYRRHDRGEWRLKCDSTLFLQFRNTVEAMKSSGTKGLMPHTPPGLNAADLKVFEKARKGDAAALVCIQKMIRDRNWVNLLGDLGHEATVQLLSQVASDDPVWKVGLVEHLKELMAELLGENPSVLEKLLVRRVVNGWIVVHRLELEYSSLASNMVDTRDCLDKAISRAQRRYTESIHELARVRRLQAPKILAQAVPADASREIGSPMIPKTPEEPTKSSEPVPPSIVNRIIDHGE